MSCSGNNGIPPTSSLNSFTTITQLNATPSCPDKFGCTSGVCPDFQIRRNDTKPDFRFDVEDCNGPIDLTNLVCEASMWAEGKLKKPLGTADTYFRLSGDIGFDQAQVGDIIVMNRVRAPEQMLITGFDELNKLIQVQRGYNGTIISQYARGCGLKIFRILNAVASTEMVREDITQVDGTVQTNVITKSTLVYEWQPGDTCNPGCYHFEFKLLQMMGSAVSMWAMGPYVSVPSISFISYTPSETGCFIGSGVEWVQRYPTQGGGFLIQIVDSPTAENVGR